MYHWEGEQQENGNFLKCKFKKKKKRKKEEDLIKKSKNVDLVRYIYLEPLLDSLVSVGQIVIPPYVLYCTQFRPSHFIGHK